MARNRKTLTLDSSGPIINRLSEEPVKGASKDLLRRTLSWTAANLYPSSRAAILACFVATMSYPAALLATTVMIRQHVDWPFWPGNILVVSVLLLQPRRLWPIIVATALLTFVLFNRHLGLSTRSIIIYQLSDVTEILTAALGLSYVFRGVPQLNSVKALAQYSLFAVLLAPFAGAFFGALPSNGEYWRSWTIAFLSQALGYLALLPAILGWVSMRSEWAHASLSRYLEASALLVGLLIPGYFSFVSPSTLVAPVLTVVPFLLWAALRFGTTSVSSLTIVVAFLAIWGAVHGSGPFVGPESVHNLPSIQVFLLFLAAPFMVLATVVEERKQSQLSLKESEERFRLAAQAGKMFAYDWDVATDVIGRSPEATQILGIDEAAQTTGQRILAQVHPDDRERVASAIAALSPGRPHLQISFRMLRADGTVIWVERRSRAHFDDRGRMLRVVGMVADVTERKKVEEVAKESETRFRLVADTAPVLIWMSGEDKLCTYFNEVWLEFTGRPFDAECGNGWLEGVHPDDLQKCLETYTQHFDQRKPFRMEYRLRRHDGVFRWVMDLGVPRFNADGSFAGYIGSAIDVTDQKLAHAALQRVSGQLIEAQEKERGRIARELHDDICQRLAMLSHKIERAAEHRGGGQLTVAQQLKQIWQECSSLTGDVQALSHELHPSILDNLGLGTAVRSYCREVAQQNGVVVELSSNLSRSLPQDVSLSVFRVVQEALRNSVKYSGQRHLKVCLQESSGHLELEISDQGVGFDVTNTRKSGGLGLVSMAERIYQVNGTLSIDSQPNAGTRIRARVPLATPSASAN
jgi:PAS domain S-box-containing protein